jgi:hypothetical protein
VSYPFVYGRSNISVTNSWTGVTWALIRFEYALETILIQTNTTVGNGKPTINDEGEHIVGVYYDTRP